MIVFKRVGTLAGTCALAFSAVLLLQASGFAAAMPKYQGEFQVHPQEVHSSAISGKMTLSYDGTTLAQVLLNLDQPVFGNSTFTSSEQWSAVSGSGSSAETTVVFKLKGPPHTFYFVYVGNSPDGGVTLAGNIYRADDTMAHIQAIVSSSFSGAPSSWKAVGNATLKGM